MGDKRAELSVEVHLMGEPCLWRWEIKESQSGQVVDSSWTAEWMAFDSPEEAYAAGRRRLDHIASD